MFSYQLFSSRNFPPLSDTLKMLAEVGYAGAEGFGGLYADKAGLAEMAAGLKANGLKMRSGHFGIDQVEQTPDWAIEVATTLGMETVIVPWLHPDQRPKDGAGWHALPARLQKAGPAPPARGGAPQGRATAPKGETLNEDGWADVGHGTVDWKTILPALRAIGVTNFVMEHDNPSDHRRFATRALASARSY